MIDRLRIYGIHSYAFIFFFILFFGHKYIDLIRLPFFIFTVWQLWAKRLKFRFFIDPVSLGIFSFISVVIISNYANGIPQNEIVDLLNWLFPYYLGKYAIIKCPEIKIDDILRYFLICATLFSMVGLLGHLLGWETLFGRELFQSGRYIFTFSGTNRAGFYLGVTLTISMYFFIRQESFSWKLDALLPVICWLIVFAGLFLIKERKVIIFVVMNAMILLLVYRHYKAVIISAVALGIILAVVPLPERYHPRELVSGRSIQLRFNAWETAWGLFKQKPLIGYGFHSFKRASEKYNEQSGDSLRFKKFMRLGIAHNISLNTLAEAGLLGCIAINVIFFSCWRFYRYRYSDRSIFITGLTVFFIYLTMQFSNFVHSSIRTDLAFFVIGLYISLEYNHRETNSGKIGRTTG